MEDFPKHLGDLCRAIRTRARPPGEELTLEEIAEQCYVSQSLLSQFEKHNHSLGEEVFECYVKCLGLAPYHEAMLLHLRVADKRKRVRETRLQNNTFSDITKRKDLVDHLRGESFPAYIMDDLWFIYAMNAPLVRLFDLRDRHLRKWQNWHVIATKFDPESPIRCAHKGRMWVYFTQALLSFYQQVGTYLFTAQRKALTSRIHEFPSGEFRRLWMSVATFSIPVPEYELTRKIVHDQDEDPIPMRLSNDGPWEYEVVEGHRVQYSMVIWRPGDSDAERVCADIRKSVKPEDIRFATEYIQDYNSWPDVRTALDKSS